MLGNNYILIISFLNLINSGVVKEPFIFKSRSFAKISPLVCSGFIFGCRAFNREDFSKIGTRSNFNGSLNLDRGNTGGRIRKGGIIGNRGMSGGNSGGMIGGKIGKMGKIGSRGIIGGNKNGGNGLSTDRFGFGNFCLGNLKSGFVGNFGNGENDLLNFGRPELMLIMTGESLETFLMISGLEWRLRSPAMSPTFSPCAGT